MHWLNETTVIEVATPTGVGADTQLQADLQALYGLGEAWQRGNAVILARLDASGVRQVVDESVAIVGTELQIDEGASGFTGDHVYQVQLIAGNLKRAEATSS
jgi:hypothetical protein